MLAVIATYFIQRITNIISCWYSGTETNYVDVTSQGKDMSAV